MGGGWVGVLGPWVLAPPCLFALPAFSFPFLPALPALPPWGGVGGPVPWLLGPVPWLLGSAVGALGPGRALAGGVPLFLFPSCLNMFTT